LLLNHTLTSFGSAQKKFLDRTFALFVDGQLPEFKIASATQEFKPLDTSSSPLRSEQQKETCQLFAAILCSLRKDVVLPVANIEDYLNDLVTLALSATHPAQVTCAARIIGSLVNKWRDSESSPCVI
jgi:DNA repair/transcription protein MET18/MMS19